MFTKTFSSLGKTDAEIAGGKGASLGEMLNAGIPVPDGFVVLSTTFDAFLKEADLIQEVEAILHTVDHKTISSVESASEKIQELIKHADMPEDIKAEVESQFSSLNSEFVAVRSSATAEDGADHAWAGQLESYLNTTQDTLLEKVQHCWASLFTPRAIFYRFEKGLDATKISVAVVVQKMVNSEKSGIAFSVHPVTEDRNQIIIEAGFGLGEAIVSGSVTPDSYVVEKEPRRIIDINVSNQTRALYRKSGGGNEWIDLGDKAELQVLNEQEILALSEIILTIENHYGFPCDIEWAYEGGHFYITQSRPITTLNLEDDREPENGQKIDFVNLWEAKYDVAWTEICASIHDKLSPYKNVVGSAPNNVIYFGNAQGMTAYYVPFELEESSKLGYQAHTKQGFIDQYYIEGFGIIDSTRKLIDDVKSLDLESLSNSQIADIYNKYALLSEESVAYYKLCNDEFQEQIADEIRTWFIAHGADAGQAQEYLLTLASEEKSNSLDSLSAELLKIANTSDENEANKIAQITSENYGWMGTFEAGSYWGADQILSQAKNVHSSQEDKEERKQKQLSELQQKYAIPQQFIQWGHQMASLANLKLELRIIWSYRDYYIGRLKQEIMKRLNVDKDVFYFFRPSEVADGLLYGRNVTNEEIENRKKAFGIFIFNGEKEFYSGGLAIEQKNKHVKSFDYMGEQIKGQIAMRGKVTGIVKIISPFNKLEDELKKVQQGDVLVTGMTRPQMIPAMHLASAFVTDEGGVTCHAAIVAREMKKPCIIATRNATKILKDGDLVEVDADSGVVKLLSSENKGGEELPNPDNYVRMFAHKTFPYLFSNVFLEYYNVLGVISAQDDSAWMSFFPKAFVEKTNKNGKELYTSESAYKKYKEDFDNYVITSTDIFENILNKETISGNDVREFFEQVSNLFVHYSKTEFFYTDGLDQGNMAITVKEFDDLKLDGRAYLNKIFFEDSGRIKTFLRKIAEQTQSKVEDLLDYSIEDLMTLVDSNKKLAANEIIDRHTFFEMGDKTLFGQEAKSIINKFFSNYLQITDVIKGTIASKGFARGVARVLVPDARDFDKITRAVDEMKEGEILVAETTSPDIIAACKKAAAIVTNQGGQLSHAAIVSRELGIPCVIGTDKDAVLNIKTGDMIEVDANNGYVKIIKK